MTDITMPKATTALGAERHTLAPAIDDAFLVLSKKLYADGALDRRTRQLIATAIARLGVQPGRNRSRGAGGSAIDGGSDARASVDR